MRIERQTREREREEREKRMFAFESDFVPSERVVCLLQVYLA